MSSAVSLSADWRALAALQNRAAGQTRQALARGRLLRTAMQTLPPSCALTNASVQQPCLSAGILVVGGAGIVFGLATYGYKIMRVLGVKMVKLTNSRGFIVEM